MFFRLSLPKEEISQREIEEILSLGNNSESFAQAFLNLEGGKVSKFLDRFEDYALSDNDIPTGNIEPIINALMDIGDLLSEGDLDDLNLLDPNIHKNYTIYSISSVIVLKATMRDSTFSNVQLRKYKELIYDCL